MARFLTLWRQNPVAPQPEDFMGELELIEGMFAVMDDLMKKGEIEEFGFFPDANSGYVISKGESADVFRRANMFQPHILSEVHEIIPYEKGKEIMIAVVKAKLEPPKK